MNEREKFEEWYLSHIDTDQLSRVAYASWQACAESKQAELDSIRFEFERSVNEHETCKRYADGLNLELDKANARIAQLELFVKDCIAADGIWIDTRLMANDARILLQGSSDTWLLEHDKAVEIKVLEEADNKCLNLPASADTVMDCSEVLGVMIESRK